MNHSQTLSAIAPALVEALAQIAGAKKGKTNPAFKSRYADLESVIAASKDILAEHGLALVQFPGTCASGVMNLETVFVHSSGEWISGEMGIALGKTDPQGVGSALTYARRYAQMAALNMPAVDDDGERAMGRVNGAPAAEPAPQHQSKAALKRSGIFETLRDEIDACQTLDELDEWNKRRGADIKSLPADWYEALGDRFLLRQEELSTTKPAGADAMDEAFRATVGGGRPAPVSGRDSGLAAA